MGYIKQKLFSFLPKFDLYVEGSYIGCIKKEFSFLKPRYNIDYNGWNIKGNWMEWDYNIIDANGENVASISQDIWEFADTYVIDIKYPQDSLCALMFVLAIDAEKASRED